jgi:hypothetical protein
MQINHLIQLTPGLLHHQLQLDSPVAAKQQFRDPTYDNRFPDRYY